MRGWRRWEALQVEEAACVSVHEKTWCLGEYWPELRVHGVSTNESPYKKCKMMSKKSQHPSEFFQTLAMHIQII